MRNIFWFLVLSKTNKKPKENIKGYTKIWREPTSAMSIYDNMSEMSVRKHTPPSFGFWPWLGLLPCWVWRPIWLHVPLLGYMLLGLELRCCKSLCLDLPNGCLLLLQVSLMAQVCLNFGKSDIPPVPAKNIKIKRSKQSNIELRSELIDVWSLWCCGRHNFLIFHGDCNQLVMSLQMCINLSSNRGLQIIGAKSSIQTTTNVSTLTPCHMNMTFNYCP